MCCQPPKNLTESIGYGILQTGPAEPYDVFEFF